jgi:hypothetical protein
VRQKFLKLLSQIISTPKKISFGSDGRKAYEEANCTYLAQTMTHTSMTLNRQHMGTSL